MTVMSVSILDKDKIEGSNEEELYFPLLMKWPTRLLQHGDRNHAI
jgi:hypothetical protein